MPIDPPDDEMLTTLRGAEVVRASSDQPIEAGQTLKGRFVLEQVLGRGGMGVVFKALDKKFQQDFGDPRSYVAVKVLTAAMLRDYPHAALALQREASRTRELGHPNIVRMYDFDSDEGVHFITMECLQGQSLGAMLKSRPQGLPKQQALWLLEQLCSGLSYAHERGLVHSDLKPSNLFVNAEGVLKILDFGIATPLRALDSSGPETLFDPRNQTMRSLTPSHAALEQWQSLPAHPKDDIYSLGCIAYELLSGQHPFGGADAMKASGAEMTVAPLSMLTRAQNAALRRALSFKRADRTASAAVFLKEMLQTGGVDKRRIAGVILGVLSCVAVVHALMHFDFGKTVPREQPAIPITQSAPPRETDLPRTDAAGKEAEQAASALAATEQAAKDAAEEKAAERAATDEEAERQVATNQEAEAQQTTEEQAAKDAAEEKAAAERAAADKAATEAAKEAERLVALAAKQEAESKRPARGKAAELERLVGTMVNIPAGEFQMGDLTGDGEPTEMPVRAVRIKAFRLGRTPVTYSQYDEFARATGRELPSTSAFGGAGRGQRPVTGVSWEDVKAYITWLNTRTGQRFRLPSEAEWEYAARAGTKTRYPWGDTFDATRVNGGRFSGGPEEVGEYPPNAFGLYDVISSVWQMTEDCWHYSYSDAPSDGSAWTTGKCSLRVIRGGSAGLKPNQLRVAGRFFVSNGVGQSDVGFRLAQDGSAVEEKALTEVEREAESKRSSREKAADLERLVGTMVDIPAGQFQMGDLAGDGETTEKPVHSVRVKAFRLGRTPVTYAQYDEFARATDRELLEDFGRGRGQRPIDRVTWQNAKAYIAWLNRRTGRRFRLPSEAEWEYAARAGTKTRYPWGDAFDATRANGQFVGDSKKEVGQYPPNAFGLYDMVASVWQWTEDCSHPDYSGAPSDGSAWMGDCTRRVSRGGSSSIKPASSRVSVRFFGSPAFPVPDTGFRLAQDK